VPDVCTGRKTATLLEAFGRLAVQVKRGPTLIPRTSAFAPVLAKYSKSLTSSTLAGTRFSVSVSRVNQDLSVLR
jgi:hypothetical protein